MPKQLHCGCCKRVVKSIAHFDTTPHYINALKVWCKRLGTEHTFKKGGVGSENQSIYSRRIIFTEAILHCRGIKQKEMDIIISRYLSECKTCGAFLPKEMSKCWYWNKAQQKSGKCPDCYHKKKEMK
jgi:hypothetical protein